VVGTTAELWTRLPGSSGAVIVAEIVAWILLGGFVVGIFFFARYVLMVMWACFKSMRRMMWRK